MAKNVVKDLATHTELLGDVNVGFTIFMQGKEAVMGVRKSDGCYVTWSYVVEDDGTDTFIGNYCWGTYSQNLGDVIAKFEEKEGVA